MHTGWLYVNFAGFSPALATLIFYSLCRCATANTPRNLLVPIASVVMLNTKKTQAQKKLQ